jgi:Ca2+-binding RTX toxin-like protein
MAYIRGTPLDDVLTGTGVYDVIVGLDGNDTIDDGGGAGDELHGGRGDDVYIIRSAGSTIVELAGEGIDTVRTALTVYQIAANIENLIFTGSGNFTGRGNGESNVIVGGSGNDVLSGFGGFDTLVGGAGDDLLDGGSGAANALQGGTGNDTYIVSAAGDTVTEFANEGIDLVRTTIASFRLGSDVENLFYDGAADFLGYGNAGDNTILGRGGNDVIYGFEGRDYLIGGAGDDYLDGGVGVANALQGGIGDDVYVVSAVGDTVTEFANEGTDTVRAVVASYILPSAVENLSFIGTGDFTGTGNAGNNIIIGGSGNDVLSGGNGRDVLIGGAGSDRLAGGFGAANELYGGQGDDVYLVDAADSVFEAAGEGTDTVITSVAASTLPSNFENLTFANYSGDHYGSGNALSNIITGSTERDVLDGGIGAADILIGGGSDDTYFVRNVGDVVIEAREEGFDTISTALSTYVLPLNVERLLFTGTGNFAGATSASGNGFIVSGAGNDTLTSNGFFDRLQGGAGNDLYQGVTSSTLIYERAGDGIDTVRATGPGIFYINDNTEIFIWTGGADGPGQIIGGSGDDVITVEGSTTETALLSGYDGNDILTGGSFGSRFVGGNGNDRITGSASGRDEFVLYASDSGIDRIIDFQSGFDMFQIVASGGGSYFEFVQGPLAAAATAFRTILYDPTTGLLAIDLDGTGEQAAIPLAYLDPGITLAVADFVI